MSRLMLIIAGIVSVVLLAGAVFVAARMLNAPADAAGDGKIVMVGDKGGGAVSISLDIKPAPELPATPPEANGLLVRREDNSIFVGTGKIEFRVEVDRATGQKQSSAKYSGPVLEVVVTRDTIIYRDETRFPEPGSAGGGTQTVQQVVKPVDSLEELGENSENTEIRAWGTRSGDRVTAQVLVYRPLAVAAR